MVDAIKAAAGKSWQTTVAGVLAALGLAAPQLAKLLDGDTATVCDWTVVLAAAGALWLGVSARDNGVSSERAGAK